MSEPDDQLFGEEHVRVYRETEGERGYHWRGAEILLLTTTGRKSGQERTMPLIHRADAAGGVCAPPRGGGPADPAWYQNLQANPDATIQVKDEIVPVRATTAEG